MLNPLDCFFLVRLAMLVEWHFCLTYRNSVTGAVHHDVHCHQQARCVQNEMVSYAASLGKPSSWRSGALLIDMTSA
jgi:hypothetical protein